MAAAIEFCLPLIFHIRGEDLERVKSLHRNVIELMQSHKYPSGDTENDESYRTKLGDSYDPAAWPIILHTFCADQETLEAWLAAFPNTYASYSKGSMDWREAKKCFTDFDRELEHTILETDAPMFDRECNDPKTPKDSDDRKPAHPNQTLDLLQIAQMRREFLDPKEVVRRLAKNTMAAFRLTDDQVLRGLLADTESTSEPKDFKDPGKPKRAPVARQAVPVAKAPVPPKQANQPPKPKAPRDNAVQRTLILALQKHEPGMHVAAITMKNLNLHQLKLRQARELLLLRIDDRSNLGLVWHQACLQAHKKGTPCSGRRIGGSLYSFDERTIPSKIPPKHQTKAYTLSRTQVPSLLQHVLLH